MLGLRARVSTTITAIFARVTTLMKSLSKGTAARCVRRKEPTKISADDM